MFEGRMSYIHAAVVFFMRFLASLYKCYWQLKLSQIDQRNAVRVWMSMSSFYVALLHKCFFTYFRSFFHKICVDNYVVVWRWPSNRHCSRDNAAEGQRRRVRAVLGHRNDDEIVCGPQLVSQSRHLQCQLSACLSVCLSQYLSLLRCVYVALHKPRKTDVHVMEIRYLWFWNSYKFEIYFVKF